jgi:hypothetical protein
MSKFWKGFEKKAAHDAWHIAAAIAQRAKKVGAKWGLKDSYVTGKSLVGTDKDLLKAFGPEIGHRLSQRAIVARAKAGLPKKGPLLDISKMREAEGAVGTRFAKSNLAKRRYGSKA